MADWTQNVSTFVTAVGTFLAILIIDTALVPYLTTSTAPIVIELNAAGFIMILAGIAIIWHRSRRKLEVSIGPRGEDPQHSEVVTRRRAFQSLNVKAMNGSIRMLVAKFTIDEQGPYYFAWGHPDLVPPQDLHHINLVAEEEADLPIWRANKENSEIHFALDSIRSQLLSDFTRPELNIVVQFIGENYTDKKPRRFKLNVTSWDELGLTEAHN